MNINNTNLNNNYPAPNNIRPLSSNIYNYPSNYNINTQELTNRNQFSDYDFRKISGGDINEYYNEIRKRKQQIRDQYKQIEQENYLNAQRKKQEKELEKYDIDIVEGTTSMGKYFNKNKKKKKERKSSDEEEDINEDEKYTKKKIKVCKRI